jgi:hypothetical protein
MASQRKLTALRECFEYFVADNFSRSDKYDELQKLFQSQQIEFLQDPKSWFEKNTTICDLYSIFQDYYKTFDDCGFLRHMTKPIERSEMTQATLSEMKEIIGIDPNTWDEYDYCIVVYWEQKCMGFAQLRPFEMYYELISIHANEKKFLEILLYDIRKLGPIHCETLDPKIISLFISQTDLKPLTLMLPSKLDGEIFSNCVKYPVLNTCL